MSTLQLPGINFCQGLLKVDPERGFSSPPLKAGLKALERVKNATENLSHEGIFVLCIIMFLSLEEAFLKWFLTTIGICSSKKGIEIWIGNSMKKPR